MELSDWEFETTMINMLRALMDKVDSMQKQTGDVSRDGNPKENRKEMLDIKNFVTEMKNAFDGLTRRLDTAEESVSLRTQSWALTPGGWGQWRSVPSGRTKWCPRFKG